MKRFSSGAQEGLRGAVLGLGLLAAGHAQEPAGAGAAIEEWLSSEHNSEQLMEDTVRAVCDDADGLAVLGAMLASDEASSDAPRGKGLRSLRVKVALEHLRRLHKSGMTFVGQYAGLAALQPWVSSFLFDLLLETPEWYPYTFRIRLVPAIRDLQPQLPDSEYVAGVIRLVEKDSESTALRYALAAALWQWGKQRHAQAFVRALQQKTIEGDGEDRVYATLELADYFNTLREYKRAAGAHRAAQALARGAGVELLPVAWYAAACVHALLGEKERGLQALERCAQLHASPDLDVSRRLERKLFENDPEIALLRDDPRFPALLALAFSRDDPDRDSGGR